MKKFNRFNAKQIEILNDPSIQSWLNEFSKHSTREQYESRIVRFLEATSTTAENLQRMDAKEVKKLFLTYQADQVKKGTKNNGILSIITAMRSYLISIDKSVDFRKGQLVNLEADNNSHIFTNGDLKLLFDVGDTFEKALIATAVSEGWEISAFLEQDKEVIARRLAHATQNNEKFIFFTNARQKTGVARFCVLNPLAIEWVTKYLAIRKDNDPRLFPITQDGVQKLLYRLAEQAGLKTTGYLRFHNIRKWLMSRLSRCGFNEFQIKYLMGKSIGVSDSTYLQTLQIEIEEKYPVVYNDYLNIYPAISIKETNKYLEEIQNEFQLTKSQLADIIAKQQKKNEELESELKTISAALKGLLPIIDNMDEVIEFLAKRRAEKELEERAEAEAEETSFRKKVMEEKGDKK